jgi:serine/threonine protein kinase
MTSRSQAMLPKVGDTLARKYAIKRVLGQGGMAVVYLATHVRLRQRVAIKMLLPPIAEVAEVAHRFEREARAVAQLHGPNVARVLDVDTTPDGLPYIVMEFIEGKDLAAEIIDRKGVFSIEEAVGFVLQACSAMAEAHALGIVHRDLKPANIFVCVTTGTSPLLKVLDFGVSKLADHADTYVTETAVVLGTPLYMSPEQIDSARKVDGRTDIWALGVILYELLACELPFRGMNAAGIITSVMADPPKPLHARRPDAPQELVDVIMKALEKDPDARHQTIADFAHALAPFGPPPGVWKAPDPPSMSAYSIPPTDAGGPDTIASQPPRFDEAEPRTSGQGAAEVRDGGSKGSRLVWLVAAVVVLGAAAAYAIGAR